MATRRAANKAVEREMALLVEVAGDPLSDGSRAALRIALESAHALVVTRAAEIVRAGEVGGMGHALRAAFDRLVPLRADGDPGCRAKVALLEALDAGAWADEEPFLGATRIVQREGGFPRPVDTATGVRARGVLALARQAWRDLPLLAAELLDDPEAPVRIAAADALRAHGARDAAGALLARLARDDDDPMVTIAAFAALLALAPDWAIDVARRGMRGGATVDRELASIALGESRRDDALDLLASWLEQSPLPADREVLLRAIGLHRTERALTILLARIADGTRADAIAAIEALAARRFDAGVAARAREAAHGKSDLLRLIESSLDHST